MREKKIKKQKDRNWAEKINKSVKKIKRFLVVLFLILAPGYVLFAAFLYFNQANFFYYPDKQDFQECASFKDYQKVKSNETRLYYHENSKDDLIVFYHGNAGSACDRTQLKRIFKKTNKSVIFVEYAGYAGDPKIPSKELIFDDVLNTNIFVQNKGFKNITVIGESIGTGPASFHAKIGQVDKLLLVSPFAKIEDVAKERYPIFPVSMMIKENYDNVEMLSDYKGEVLIIYGSEDQIIPVEFSQELYEKLAIKEKEQLSVFGATHNNLFSFIETVKGIETFIQDEK